MSKYEILEAFCELENSKGEISDADFKEFALKNNLIEWEGDFSDDLYKHRFLKEEYPKIATKEYSQQLEKSYYGPPNEEKEKKRQELKNKGFSDKEIFDYLIEKDLDEFKNYL